MASLPNTHSSIANPDDVVNYSEILNDSYVLLDKNQNTNNINTNNSCSARSAAETSSLTVRVCHKFAIGLPGVHVLCSSNRTTKGDYDNACKNKCHTGGTTTCPCSSTCNDVSYMDKRPSSCPPAIDLWLWGGLSTSIVEACGPVERTTTNLCACFPMIAWLFLCIGWAGGFHFVTNTSALLYWLGIAPSVLVLSWVLGWVLTCYWYRGRDSVFHNRVRDAIENLKPHFHRVGYDLMYHVEESCCQTLSWVHIIPVDDTTATTTTTYNGFTSSTTTTITGELLPTHHYPRPAHATCAASASSNSRRPRDFRVPVYGNRVFAHGSFSTGRTEDLQLHCIDKFTWGAVATELQPFTRRFYQMKWWMMRLNLLIVVLSMAFLFGGQGLPEPIFWSLSILFSFLPFILSESIVENFILYKKWLRNDSEIELAFSPMQDKIQELSPMVMERTGYSLVFRTEREGCCSTGAYVCFEQQQQGHGASHGEP